MCHLASLLGKCSFKRDGVRAGGGLPGAASVRRRAQANRPQAGRDQAAAEGRQFLLHPY